MNQNPSELVDGLNNMSDEEFEVFSETAAEALRDATRCGLEMGQLAIERGDLREASRIYDEVLGYVYGEILFMTVNITVRHCQTRPIFVSECLSDKYKSDEE